MSDGLDLPAVGAQLVADEASHLLHGCQLHFLDTQIQTQRRIRRYTGMAMGGGLVLALVVGWGVDGHWLPTLGQAMANLASGPAEQWLAALLVAALVGVIGGGYELFRVGQGLAQAYTRDVTASSSRHGQICHQIVQRGERLQQLEQAFGVEQQRCQELHRQIEHRSLQERALAQAAGDLVLWLTPTAQITRVEGKQELRKLLAVGHTLSSRLAAPAQATLQACLTQLFTRHEPLTWEGETPWPELRVVSARLVSWREADGSSGAVVALRSVEQERHAEQEQHERFEWLLGDAGHPSFLASSGQLDQILGSQLNVAVGETEKAALAIMSQGQTLLTQTKGLLAYLDQTNNETQDIGKNSATMMKEDQRAIADLRAFLESADERRRIGHGQVKAAIEEVRNLTSLVHMVLDVSERTTILAMNAAIVAGRAKEQGDKFAVVALEVKRLAVQVRDAAQRIEAGITAATATVEKVLGDRLDARKMQDEEALLKKSVEQMARLGEHYTRLLHFNHQTMTRVTDWNRTMSTEIVDMVSRVQFQDIVRQQVEQVVRALLKRKEYTDTLEKRLRQPSLGQTQECFSVEEMMSEYVMQRQRMAHVQGTGHKVDTQDEGGSVDLF